MVDPSINEESVGRSVYEHLIRLTFLCGRGLPLEDLMGKFLATMRPTVPASGAWLFRDGLIFAASAEPGIRPPFAPPADQPVLMPCIDADDRINAWVMPGTVLVCQLRGGGQQRSCDVASLFARIIALAWQAETVVRAEPWPDDYAAAKAVFKRRWLGELIARHHGNISAASRASRVSRTYLYDTLRKLGMHVEGDPPPPPGISGEPRSAPETTTVPRTMDTPAPLPAIRDVPPDAAPR